jgi:hypothetical protein
MGTGEAAQADLMLLMSKKRAETVWKLDPDAVAAAYDNSHGLSNNVLNGGSSTINTAGDTRAAAGGASEATGEQREEIDRQREALVEERLDEQLSILGELKMEGSRMKQVLEQVSRDVHARGFREQLNELAATEGALSRLAVA